jgi:2'-5' RNA ligase
MPIMAYSTWFMPSGKTYEELSKMILYLSKENSTPLFEPHITLLGSIVEAEAKVFEKISIIANRLQPFEIKLMHVGYQDEFFRCLFIKAEKSTELTEANSLAKKLFNREKDPSYMPHLSLMYGNFNPEIKEKTITKIGKQITFLFEARKITIVSHFLGQHDTSSWKIVKEFPFKKS